MKDAWQVYLDNYFSGHVKSDAQSKLVTAADRWHHSARAAWAAWGIPSATDKSLTHSAVAK